MCLKFSFLCCTKSNVRVGGVDESHGEVGKKNEIGKNKNFKISYTQSEFELEFLVYRFKEIAFNSNKNSNSK